MLVISSFLLLLLLISDISHCLITTTSPNVTCPHPPLVPNSRVNYPNRNVGAVANYTCFAAYHPVGLDDPPTTTLTCLPDGQWSDADFACVSKNIESSEFDLPSAILNQPNDPGIPEDATGIPVSLVFAEEGVVLNAPIFTGMFCETLPRITHGSIVEEGSTSFSTAVGSRLSFICNNGYYLVGTMYIECLPNLNWTEPPTCRPYCKNPPIVPDSVQRIPKRIGHGRYFTTNMTVEYVCNSGFVLVAGIGATLATNETAESAVTCLANGHWTDPPMCLRVEMEQSSSIYQRGMNNDFIPFSPTGVETCGPPPPVRHGNVTLLQSSRQYTVGDTAKYICNKNYRLVGPSVIECMQNLRWSMNPTCISTHLQDTCPPPPTVPDSIHVKANPDTGWIAGETVLYLCQRGFFRSGDPVVQCMPRGYWTSPPRCILQNNAEANSHQQPSPRSQQSQSWNIDRTPAPPPNSPSAAVQQQSGGSFSASPKKQSSPHQTSSSSMTTTPFNKFDCQPPPDVEHGYIVQVTPVEGRYPRGTVVTYRCAPAYTLYGDASIICTDILLWETPPQCRGTYNDPKTTGQPPFARAADGSNECPLSPPLPPNTRIIERYMPTGKASIGSFIVIDCLPDYVMIDGAGSPILWCDSNYRWQHQEPPLQCVSKAMQTTTARWVPPTRNWVPTWGGNNQPYTTMRPKPETTPSKQSGPLHFHTDANGDPYWPDLTTSTLPPITGTTEVPSCTPPPEIANGFMVKITRPNYQNAREMHRKNILYYYGVTVTYVCASGFHFMGASTVMCQWSGEWSGVPLCIPLQPATKGTLTTTPWYTILPEITVSPPVTPPYWYNTTTKASGGTTIPGFQPTVPFVYTGGGGQMPTTFGGGPLPPGRTTEMLPWVTAGPGQISCDLPPTISDGVVMGRSPTLGPMGPGSSVEYACMGDLMIYGNSVVRCLSNGTWERPPACVPPYNTQTETTTQSGTQGGESTSSGSIGTGTEGTAGNGTGSGTKTTAKGSLTTTTTQSTSTTTKTKQKQCVAPPAIPNGELIYVLPLEYAAEKTYFIGTAATYGCSSGYKMIGTPTAYCTNDYTWQGVPVCAIEATTTQLARCAPPPDIPNGVIVTNSAPNNGVYNPGSSVQYQCLPNYRMIGFPRIFCTFELAWEGAPICELEPPDALPLTFSTTPETTTTTTKVITEATTAMVEETTAGNGDSGMTNGCASPPSVAFASLISAPSPPYLMGAIARYACAPGYALMGPDSVVCLPFSIWSTPPECIPFSTSAVTTQASFVAQTDCPPPPVIEYGTSSVGGMAAPSYSPGSAVVYSCDAGYALVGTPIVICAVDGQWSTPPDCVPQRNPSARSGSVGIPKRNCPEPPAVIHGYRSTQSIADATVGWQTGDSFDIECFPPYMRLGRGKTVCSEDGTWSTTPACVRTGSNSPFPTQQRAKSASSNSPRYRYKVEPRQQLGPIPYSSSSQEQQEPQQEMAVVAKACSHPPAVDNAVAVLRSGSNQLPGAAYLYICEPPYRLRGSPTVICSASGQWSAVPSCEPTPNDSDLDEFENQPEATIPTERPAIYCGSPPTIENGKVMSVPATSVVGSLVTYECLSQYQMRGPYTISCLPSGRWSKTPDCVPLPANLSQRNNRAYIATPTRDMLPPPPVKAQSRSGPMLFSSRFDTPNSLFYTSSMSSTCYGGPDWPSKLLPGQLSTKLATRELHIFREVVFNCTGIVVEWRYISVLPLKSEPVIVHFGVWRLVHPRGLKYRLVASTRVTIVGSLRPEETVLLKLHEAEFLHVEPGDVFGLHYDTGASSQKPGAIPLAYTFSPSPFTQPQLSSTLASLDDHNSMMRKQMASKQPGKPGELIVDFDNYGFRFFRLPFVRAVVHMI